MYNLDYKNLQFKQIIDGVVIDLWSPINFASMNDIRRKCSLIVDSSKFISNKTILSGVVVLSHH